MMRSDFTIPRACRPIIRATHRCCSLNSWAHRERFCTVPVKLCMNATWRIVNVTGSALVAARQLWGVLLCCGIPLVTSSCALKEDLPPRAGAHPHESASYDFRQTPAYRQLSGEEKKKLEAVHRDFILLAGALAVYYADQDRMLPESLDALVPKYLAELPRDPFAATRSPQERQSAPWTPSAGGFGYDYDSGSAGNWAWRLRSAGLPEFPYATASSRGLHLLMGEWISGRNPMRQYRADR